jgi:hypothetical protein
MPAMAWEIEKPKWKKVIEILDRAWNPKTTFSILLLASR